MFQCVSVSLSHFIDGLLYGVMHTFKWVAGENHALKTQVIQMAILHQWFSRQAFRFIPTQN